MGETLKVLKTRRSCRKYSDKLVPDDIINKILEAGTYAATGMGRQAPIILDGGKNPPAPRKPDYIHWAG